MTRSFSYKLLYFLSILFFINIATAKAQLVNIEKERKAKTPGIQGATALSFNIIENTNRIIQGNNNTNIQLVSKNLKHTFLILNDYTLMKVIKDQNNYDLINKNFQHFRYNYTFYDTNAKNFGAYTYELFFQRQQNKIKYIKLRLLAGTGPRFRIINTSTSLLYICPLTMYEYEILSDSAQTITKTIKGDLYWSLTIKINNIIQFTNVTYYQPAYLNLNPNFTNFEAIKDYRLSSESGLIFNLIKDKVQFMTIFNLSYDSRPPVELINHPLFFTFKNSLSIKF